MDFVVGEMVKGRSENMVGNRKISKPSEEIDSCEGLKDTNLIHLKEGKKEWTLELKPMNFEG
ncbi:hypothetical protein AKJ51_02915 [candidate division MSBL1 archaeon SCGC-AAA382A20]|uniref:Uncharacterized protein n=1 Tax=candidate division MSBL1 archaeon SCGC-AAA382A20 TaxID=1698280 RepID=A0A133VJY8_9EURY|nr:hypothetical protein AKJ51_02915 [candidate division MSBL1 archaeon SCGC-AAA382A20]